MGWHQAHIASDGVLPLLLLLLLPEVDLCSAVPCSPAEPVTARYIVGILSQQPNPPCPG
jgi:hypothetical protein